MDLGGQEVELEFDLTLKGDALDGNVSVGEFGTYPISSTRKTKPN
jgi:hypothetical protein